MNGKDFEEAYEFAVRQIFFVNDLGEVEYHPERRYFLNKYIYCKYILKNNDVSINEDIFSLSLYQEEEKILDKLIEEDDYKIETNDDMFNIWQAVETKVAYEKSKSLKSVTFSATDIYLAELVQKATDAFDNLGLDKLDAEGLKGFLDVLAKIGDTNGNKKLPRTKKKAK